MVSSSSMEINGDGGVLIGFEKTTTPWPASHNLHHMQFNKACKANKEWINRIGGLKRYQQHHNQHVHRSRVRSEPPTPPPNLSTARRHHHNHQERPKMVASNYRMAYGGGPGMQAFFLGSRPRSSGGTGVFLPRRLEAENYESGCAPVLLPTRVVQALNLNVHELGLHIPPRKDVKYTRTFGGSNSENRRKNNGNRTSECYVVSRDRSFSPHVFLPKEWTY